MTEPTSSSGHQPPIGQSTPTDKTDDEFTARLRNMYETRHDASSDLDAPSLKGRPVGNQTQKPDSLAQKVYSTVGTRVATLFQSLGGLLTTAWNKANPFKSIENPSDAQREIDAPSVASDAAAQELSRLAAQLEELGNKNNIYALNADAAQAAQETSSTPAPQAWVSAESSEQAHAREIARNQETLKGLTDQYVKYSAPEGLKAANLATEDELSQFRADHTKLEEAFSQAKADPTSDNLNAVLKALENESKTVKSIISRDTNERIEVAQDYRDKLNSIEKLKEPGWVVEKSQKFNDYATARNNLAAAISTMKYNLGEYESGRGSKRDWQADLDHINQLHADVKTAIDAYNN